MLDFLTGPSDKARRRLVVVAALCGATLMFASYWGPWWHFQLVAPQYPRGLELGIRLTGVTGDVEEINLLNHYIGMGHLEEAAQLERAHALTLLSAIAVSVIVLVQHLGRRLNGVLVLLAAALPVGFLADTFYWMYRFGHELDPRAPVTIQGFTPTLFGAGKIGQFHTVATPEWGFWMATAGAALVIGAAWFRNRVCTQCPLHDTCGLACAHRVPEAAPGRARSAG